VAGEAAGGDEVGGNGIQEFEGGRGAPVAAWIVDEFYQHRLFL